MRHSHRWTCTRSGPVTGQDPDTGQPTYGASSTVFDGPADCQDGGEETSRDTEGRLVVRSLAVLFLDPEDAAHDHAEGDVGTVTWEDGSTDDAEITSIRRIDGRMELKWL